jgi:uncharacterized protein (DUF934 family)
MALTLISSSDLTENDAQVAQSLTLANDADAQTVALDGITHIALNFPKFTDGRAFSQAYVLRRRGFTGEIQARGDVLIDQLLQMQRSGFSSAVLRADQDAAHGQKLLGHYSQFYQGDAVGAPRFQQAA